MNRVRAVYYKGAAHGDWCNTKTYPINCKYCNKQVFYFSCDQGCKVFFDELGPPWPIHRCPEYIAAMNEGLR